MFYRMSGIAALVLLILLIGSCGNNNNSGHDDRMGDDDTGNNFNVNYSLSDPNTMVPSDFLQQDIIDQTANNNLDIVMHDSKLFFVFRTAPSHFASTKTNLYVISSEDEINWVLETNFSYGTDLREPRFLSFNGHLFLYFAVLGNNPTDFEPQGIMCSEYQDHSNWTEPEWIYKPGFIAWRTKVIDGIPYMLAYKGGENIYDFNGKPMEVHWLTTKDGRNWKPVIPGQPSVLTGGGSETDFVFLDDGSLIAVSRNEEGDKTGWGSKICRADPDSLGDWQCVHDPRKYDSPLVFRHGQDIYLIGRRNVTADGNYDLGYNTLPIFLQTLLYEADYWFHPKRTSLWKINPKSLEVSFIMDFPSKGDTCFPGLVPLNENEYLIYNYTSPLDGPDVFWLQGQLGPTLIYSIRLKIE